MIVLAYDHRAKEMFDKIKSWLSSKGFEYIEFASAEYDANDDYCTFASLANKEVKKGAIGIYGCGSGVGMSIACNRVKGIRGALCHDVNQTEHARANDDANVLILPTEYICFGRAKRMIETFLNTPFNAIEKYKNRNKFLDTIE